MIGVPLVIVFAPGTSLYREQDLISHLPIVRNGPAGTFVVFPSGVSVSLPTDQVVSADEKDGAARVGFGGVRSVPEEQLSPARSHIMTLEASMVSSVLVEGHQVWRAGQQ